MSSGRSKGSPRGQRRPAPAPPAPAPLPPAGLAMVASDPAPGLPYHRVLTGPGASPGRALVGALLGLSLYFSLVPLAVQAIVALGWLGQGRPTAFGEYYRSSLAFERPIGLLAGHLGLGLLIPISVLLVRYLHGRPPRWLASVQPGLRWRYLLFCLLLAAVVLNAIMLLGRLGQGWQFAPQSNLWLWLGLVLLTAPLQAAAEEFFFRGLLLQGFGALARSPWAGVVASSVIFALMHGTQNLPLFVDRLGFGLLAGWLVVRTGGLEAGIGCHVANNVFAFGWAAVGGGIAQTRAVQAIGWGSAAADLLGFALFAVLAWLVGRRLRVATTTPQVVDGVRHRVQ